MYIFSSFLKLGLKVFNCFVKIQTKRRDRKQILFKNVMFRMFTSEAQYILLLLKSAVREGNSIRAGKTNDISDAKCHLITSRLGLLQKSEGWGGAFEVQDNS